MGIEPEWLSRWPSELSGGELQRFCIARVLSPLTRFLLCDEISSMLDVVSQAQIWQLVVEVADINRLGLLVVTHNTALAGRVCRRVIALPEINDIR
jgi:peptide/nickel transport system ATP-binding protein